MEAIHQAVYPAFRISTPPKVGVLERGMVEAVGYDIVRISVQDSERVLDFLKKFFFRDEPLNICVGLLDEPGSTCAELEAYCVNTIPEGVSCMAVSGQNEILGVCLSGILERQEGEESKEPPPPCTHPRFSKIQNLLATVGIQSDVFGQYPDIDRVLDLRVLSVDDACRGRGIAKALIERSKQMAKEDGIRMVRVDCTSHFSAMAVSRLGFHCIYTLNYSDHLDSAGEPVFDPPSPHACVKTYVAPVSL